MLITEQLQEFLRDYDPKAEVVMMGNTIMPTAEIKHVGMAIAKDGNYKVILASEKPSHFCKECGNNVYRAMQFLTSDAYHCFYCNKMKFYPNDVQKIEEDV